MSKGGGSSMPANTTSTVTNEVQLPSWVDQFAQQNVGTAQSLAAQPYTPYTGQTVAPMNALQTAAINAAGSTLGSTAPVFNKAISNVENLPQTTQSLLSPYLGSVENAAVSDIQRQGAISGENIASGAVGQGAFGGTRYGVEQALNASETQRNIGNAVASIGNTGWNQAMTAALQQASSMGNLAAGGQQTTLQGAQAALSAGGAQQTQQQAQDEAALQQWQQAQNWPYQQLAISQGALAGTPYGTTTKSTQPYAQNTTANAIGNIAAGVGLANSGYNLGSGIYSNLFGSGGLFGGAASAAPAAGDVAGLWDTGAAAAGTAYTGAMASADALAAGTGESGLFDVAAAAALA